MAAYIGIHGVLETRSSAKELFGQGVWHYCRVLAFSGSQSTAKTGCLRQRQQQLVPHRRHISTFVCTCHIHNLVLLSLPAVAQSRLCQPAAGGGSTLTYTQPPGHELSVSTALHMRVVGSCCCPAVVLQQAQAQPSLLKRLFRT